MSALSPILRDYSGGSLAFWCPGCNEVHVVGVTNERGPRPVWGYNGNPASPTFEPSILVTTGHYVGGKSAADCKYCSEWSEAEKDNWGHPCAVCHSFVTDGRIQFLNDCTHALAGQTVDLPEFPA